MEVYDQIIRIVDANWILCLVPLILTLIVTESLFKNRFETKEVLNLVRWSIIIYTFITTSFFIMRIIFFSDDFAIINRATGPYAWMYWLMLLSSVILPFTLLIKRLAIKPWYVLCVVIFMKSGVYFERFVIIVTSFHRDYFPDHWASGLLNFPVYAALLFVNQGFVLAILLLVLFEFIKTKK